MQTVTITTSQNIDIDYSVASLGDRIVARVIDYLIFLCIYIICIIAVLAYLGVDGMNGGRYAEGSQWPIIIVLIVWLVLCVFYDLLTEIFLNGQSIGKRTLKIKVISLNGARPTLSQYLLRWVFRIIDFGVTLGSAAVVSVAFSDNKQRIGDMVAGTTLVKTSPVNRITDLVFSDPPADYQPTYNQVSQLTDQDMLLIRDVIKNFNRTRNSNLVYKLALQIKNHLQIAYPANINEYQFLEIVVNDYNFFIAKSDSQF